MRVCRLCRFGQIRERIVHGKMLDALRREVLFRDVARGTAYAEYFAVLIVGEAGVDPDPAILAGRRDDVRDVVLDFTFPAQRGQEAAVGDVGGARFEVEEAAADADLWEPGRRCRARPY